MRADMPYDLNDSSSSEDDEDDDQAPAPTMPVAHASVVVLVDTPPPVAAQTPPPAAVQTTHVVVAGGVQGESWNPLEEEADEGDEDGGQVSEQEWEVGVVEGVVESEGGSEAAAEEGTWKEADAEEQFAVVMVGSIPYRVALSATTKSGFLGVHSSGKAGKPWKAHVSGRYMGMFASKEDAAVYVTKFLTEGEEAAATWHQSLKAVGKAASKKRAGAEKQFAVVMVGSIPYRVALSATTKSGFLGVHSSGKAGKPWKAHVSGRHMGMFASKEDAAVYVTKFLAEGEEAATTWRQSLADAETLALETLALEVTSVPVVLDQQLLLPMEAGEQSHDEDGVEDDDDWDSASETNDTGSKAVGAETLALETLQARAVTSVSAELEQQLLIRMEVGEQSHDEDGVEDDDWDTALTTSEVEILERPWSVREGEGDETPEQQGESGVKALLQRRKEASAEQGKFAVIIVGSITYRVPLSATTKSGFLYVQSSGKIGKPWQATLAGRYLGRFASKQDAAVCVAKFLAEGEEAAAAWRQSFGNKLNSNRDIVRKQDDVELYIAPENTSGYKCVVYHPVGSQGGKRSRPFRRVHAPPCMCNESNDW